MTNKNSFTIARFKNRQNKERNVFDKIVINNNIPTEQEVSDKGFVQYLKRVGGQVHLMYSLVDYEWKKTSEEVVKPSGFLRIEESEDLLLINQELLYVGV